MAKVQSRYVCQACGTEVLRWEGQCRTCGAWNTLVETVVRDPGGRHRAPAGLAGPRGGAGAGRVDRGRPMPLALVGDVPILRLPTGIGELDRVLGGGLVPGSLVLVGGEPGIGKSTLLLQAAARLADGLAGRGASSLRAGDGQAAGCSKPAASPQKAVAADMTAGTPPTGEMPARGLLYVTAEESAAQVRLRAERLGLLGTAAASGIALVAENDVGRIVELVRSARPAVVIVDSIQTVSAEELDGPAGSVGQVRECAQQLRQLAKDEDVAIILVGHVTKDGTLAGPKTLEHLVDAVLALEGDRYGRLRLVRASKNRFGATDEVGVFEMREQGLLELVDAGGAFFADHARPEPGSIVAPLLEGSRALLVEVQALVAPGGGFGAPRRTTSGLDPNRLSLLVAILARRGGVGLGSHDLYVNLAGGLEVGEPGLDLPVALALASAARDRAIPRGTIAVGELGLLGELRPVPGLERRLREAARLGFTRAIVPPLDRAAPIDRRIEVVPVTTLREALDAVFGRAGEDRGGA